MKSASQRIEIFKFVTHNIDTNSGRIGLKGKHTDETKYLSVSELIPYFARDIFLAQKNEFLPKTQIDFQILSGLHHPIIEMTLNESSTKEDLLKTRLYLVQFLWSYNYISYDAMEDRYKQRFSYSFVSKPACDSAEAA